MSEEIRNEATGVLQDLSEDAEALRDLIERGMTDNETAEQVVAGRAIFREAHDDLLRLLNKPNCSKDAFRRAVES